MSEKLKDKIDSLKTKNQRLIKQKTKKSDLQKKLESRENNLNTLPRGLEIDTTTGIGANINKIENDYTPKRLQKKETTIDKVKMSKGGRVNFRGGGCTTKGINKKAYGKNS